MSGAGHVAGQLLGVVAGAFAAPYRMTVAGGGRLLAGLGASPNGVTATGLAVGIGGSVAFILTHNAFLFAATMLIGALLDALDGEVARLRARESRAGSYFDAICDRIYEVAMIFAAASVSDHWSLCFLFLAGSLGISYAKARVALEVATRNDAWPDLMERDKRLAGFVLAILVWACFPDARPLGRDLFFWGLICLNLAVAFTLVQRFRRAFSLIRAAERSAQPRRGGRDLEGR